VIFCHKGRGSDEESESSDYFFHIHFTFQQLFINLTRPIIVGFMYTGNIEKDE
jgi:hypothetical protein